MYLISTQIFQTFLIGASSRRCISRLTMKYAENRYGTCEYLMPES